ncbi:Bcr/CflA family multidrug efflux MFS transporter [Maribrevibacterium harenarium]|uniref:Bcr/CflA family efflux transporter n=1 Tax=Maribrevibacterium harenarium TaxID=2589817 RepID=A0A501X1T8_9GAMM|nr:Bcr/CflA family multidrug efflux MFS transporter [Maribrevibacterium harenarium]TPE54444.1 Bcr/CflA family multidrug efflux MFS transporter [Maribrevibacterium harenarium]
MSTVTTSIGRSRLLIPLLGYLVAFGPLSVDMYLPSLPTIAADLDSPQSTIQYTITSFLVGMAIGMLLFGPLSDLLGRKKLLLVGTFCYVLASIGCALAQTGESLVMLRFAQSLGAASAAVLARALVRDLFGTQQAAGILSTMHIISMIVMLMAPILGAYIVRFFDWRWIFYFLGAFSAVAFIGIALIIQEPSREKNASFNIKDYFRAYGECLSIPAVTFYILTNGFSFAGMFAFIAASAFVYIDAYGFSETSYGFFFSANIGAIILMTVLNKRLVKHYSSSRALHAACLVSLGATIAMSLIALFFHELPLLFLLGTMLYISVTGSIGANCLAILFSIVPERAGTAAGLLVAGQFAFGGLCSYVTTLVFDGSAASLLLVMAGCGSACVVCYLFTQGGFGHIKT